MNKNHRDLSTVTRKGNILLSVIALTSLMLALTLALTIKVQANMQASSQIRKFAQSYLIASTVHTRWPGMKETNWSPDNSGGPFLKFQANFWDLAYDHYWKNHTDFTAFMSPPSLLGYVYSQGDDVSKHSLLCNGGNKSAGFNNVHLNAGKSGSGWGYEYCLTFITAPTVPLKAAHTLSPADPTFPRPNSGSVGVYQLANVFPP